MVRACLLRLPIEDTGPIEHSWPMIRSEKQLAVSLRAIEDDPGIVIYDLTNEEFSDRVIEACRRLAVPCVSLYDAPFYDLVAYFGAQAVAPLLFVGPHERVDLALPTISGDKIESAAALSVDALTELRGFLEGCRPDDIDAEPGDNRQPIPIGSNLYAQILAEIDAGVSLLRAPRLDSSQLTSLWAYLSKVASALKPMEIEFQKKFGATLGVGGAAILVALVANLTGATEQLNVPLKLLTALQ